MARQPETPDVVEEIETGVERLARWIGNNPWAAGAIAVGILAAAGALSSYASWRSSREAGASDALETVRAEYLVEMGASPTALEVPELANPKAAAEIRERYLARFREVAEREQGTAAATLAWLEAADLLAALGRRDEIAALYAEAAKSAPNPALGALVQRRLGSLHEDAGRFAEAAAAYQSAAAIPAYPLRYFALADAARCLERDGRPAEALALYDRLRAEAPDHQLPEHQAAQLRELRAAQPQPTPPAPTAPPAPAAAPGTPAAEAPPAEP